MTQNNVSVTNEVITWIATYLPKYIYFNLMSQDKPMHRAFDYKDISRQITKNSYFNAVNWAKEPALTYFHLQGIYKFG